MSYLGGIAILGLIISYVVKLFINYKKRFQEEDRKIKQELSKIQQEIDKLERQSFLERCQLNVSEVMMEFLSNNTPEITWLFYSPDQDDFYWIKHPLCNQSMASFII